MCRSLVRLDGFTVNTNTYGFHFWVAITTCWWKTGILSSFCISHTGQGKGVNYTSFQSRKELPLLLIRWRVTFQGTSSRKFYIQQGLYISMNWELQARSYETITNSLTDLLSAQDLCKHQYTSAKWNLLPTISSLTQYMWLISLFCGRVFLASCVFRASCLCCAEKSETRGQVPTWRINCNVHMNIYHCKIHITLGRKKLPTCLWKEKKKIKKPKLRT